MLNASLNHFKSVTTHNFLVAPADNNYFLARFCRIYGLYDEFWWQSAQALEKYLKAGIVLNGHSSRRYRHNLVSLYDKHKEVYGGLAFLSFYKPAKLIDDLWRQESVESFISRVNLMGDPDSRYGLISRFERTDDLFKFDQITFELRRRTVGLDWIVGEDFPAPDSAHEIGSTYADAIKSDSNFQPRDFKINEFNLTMAGDNLSDVLHSWNFSMQRNDHDLAKPSPRTVTPLVSAKNSELFLIYEELTSMPSKTNEVRDKVNWMLESFYFDRETEREIRKLI